MSKDSKAMRVWLEDLSTKSDRTRYMYTRNLKKFLSHYDMTADELYEMRREDLKSEDPRDRGNVERMVKVQMSEMSKSGKAASTCRQVSKALTSFFESQGMPLNLKARDHPKGMSNGQRLALADDIRTMWDYSSTEFKLRNRAAIAFLKDSGLRISDANALNVGDWLKAETKVRNGDSFKEFQPHETLKTKAPAYIMVGEEAIESVEAYLEERRERELPMDPESPLFLNRRNTRFHSDGFGHIFIRLGQKVGRQGISAHSLRKFHTTQLQSAGIADSWIKKLQGKVVGGSMGPYSRPEESGQLFEAYAEAYHKLRIFGVEASASELEDLRREVERLRAGEGSDVKALRREVEELKDMLKLIYEDPDIIQKFRESQKT